MMKIWIAGVIVLAIVVGLIFGLLLGMTLPGPTDSPAPPDTVHLAAPEQDDYVIMVAEAYAAERDLKLAQDRLARLKDNAIAARVERLALTYVPQRDQIATNLALLAVALGSRNRILVGLSAGPTPPAPRTAASSRTQSLNVAFAETAAPTSTATPRPTRTIWYKVITNTFTPTSPPTDTPIFTRTPTFTRVPSRTPLPTATATPLPTDTPRPPPPTIFEPGLDQWWGSIYFQPADIPSGQGYWHLARAVYCDAFDNSDPRRRDFGCDEMPGGSQGTSIYVMTGGNPIDVFAPDGRNVGDDRAVVGDLKAPDDMCQCTYAWESSDYRVSVRGAPSDAIGGFCLCGKNFGWGSHAHVRYFLYFEYITR